MKCNNNNPTTIKHCVQRQIEILQDCMCGCIPIDPSLGFFTAVVSLNLPLSIRTKVGMRSKKAKRNGCCATHSAYAMQVEVSNSPSSITAVYARQGGPPAANSLPTLPTPSFAAASTSLLDAVAAMLSSINCQLGYCCCSIICCLLLLSILGCCCCLLRLHCWEEQHLLDVDGVREHHGHTVNAHTPPARGGQSVLQGCAEGLIHKHSFIIALQFKQRGQENTLASGVIEKQDTTRPHISKGHAARPDRCAVIYPIYRHIYFRLKVGSVCTAE